jgi:hypothetical protein
MRSRTAGISADHRDFIRLAPAMRLSAAIAAA